MTKDEFIKKCNEQMANICDPERQASNRCRRGAKKYKIRERKAKMKNKKPRSV